MRCDFDGAAQEERDVSLEGQVVPIRMIPFSIWNRCYRGMEILMRTLAIESKQGGSSGDKLLAFSVTRGYHKS